MSSYTAPPPNYSAYAKNDEEANAPLLSGEGSSTSRGLFGDAGSQYKGATVSQSSVMVRMEFVRKVYSILSVQLLGTIIMSATFMYNEPIKEWVQNHSWPLYTAMLSTLLVLLALIWKRQSVPTNFYLLALFTALESYCVGVVVTFYDKTVVLQALIVTFVIFGGLTMFTLQSKWDFEGMGPFLFTALLMFASVSLLNIFFPFGSAMEFCLALIGVVIFSFYIIFDTYMIFNKLSPDEYIMASVELYLDLINLFLQLLRVFAAMQRSD